MEAKMPTMATVIIISINVKPSRRLLRRDVETRMATPFGRMDAMRCVALSAKLPD
jgi:hypothetical protein